MKWITRERPKIDRIACPWLIARFIDAEAEFLYVHNDQVFQIADETGAIPYDISGADFSHVVELCSFDAFLDRYQLDDPALKQLAAIVRGADTSRLDLTPESPGLYAISLGLSHVFKDDLEMLDQGLILYDALYAWCQHCQNETHHWPPSLT
ncbi:MAG: chromate resistance protein ChrB domain-containing protein [Methylomonas sp.]